jgi:hypothetical protein
MTSIPIEIWREIALLDPQVYHSLAQVIRGLSNVNAMRRHFSVYGLYYGTCGQRLPNGLPHSFDKPNVIYNVRVFSKWYNVYVRTVGKVWFHEGCIHRDNNEPAVICDDGIHAWYQHGKLHRDGDEPAIIDHDGELRYYKYGKLHRDHGQPAVITHDHYYEYWIDGIKQ